METQFTAPEANNQEKPPIDPLLRVRRERLPVVQKPLAREFRKGVRNPAQKTGEGAVRTHVRVIEVEVPFTETDPTAVEATPEDLRNVVPLHRTIADLDLPPAS